MKKILPILLLLSIVTLSLSAVAADPGKTIVIKAPVDKFTIFAVTKEKIADENYKTQAAFESIVTNSIDKEISMLDLAKPVDVGYLAGINNTPNKVGISLKTTPLVYKDNTVALNMVDGHKEIPGSSNSRYGVLKSTVIQIKEATPGAAALAPAGDYKATITVFFTHQ